MKRVALASALLALLGASIAIAPASAEVKLPTYSCRAPDEPCSAATLIHATYSAPPAEAQAGSTFAITVAGQLRAPADDKVCRVHRKVEVPVEWLRGSKTPRTGPTKITHTDGEGRFSLEMTVTAPAGSTGYEIPIYAEGTRRIKGGRLGCEESEQFSQHWSIFPGNGWDWGGEEAPAEYE
jgi:hypothetical protein